MENKGFALRDEYRIRFSRMADYRNAVWKILCDRFFSRYVPPGAAVLDLGSGWGEFINNIEAADKLAMDLNPDTQQHLSADVRFLHQDCAQPWQISGASLDVVFSSNFIEHLPDKRHVERSVAEAYRCLKPGGFILFFGPNIKYVPGAYWDFWDHYIPITELSLVELLRMNQFNIERCIPRFLPYSMSTGKRPPLFLVRWYLKIPMIWPLFGKQFLVVGRK